MPNLPESRYEQLAGPRALVFGVLLGLLFWILLGLAVCAVRADTDDSQSMTAIGMAQWESVSGARFGPVTVHVAPLLAPIYYSEQAAQTWVGQDGCEVRLDPAYWPALSPQGRQNVVTHELGHCLGLDHSIEPGVMQNPLFFDFSPADGALARARWPLPYRVAVALP
jgi:hypothetical protein